MKKIGKFVLALTVMLFVASSLCAQSAGAKTGADCKTDVENNELTWVLFSKKTCKPCSKVMKVAAGLYEKFKDKGLNVIVIATDDEVEGVLAKMKDAGLNVPCYPAKDNELLKDKVKDGVPQSIFYKKGAKQGEPILGAFDEKKAKGYLKKYFGL